MFSLGWAEIFLIAVVALIVVGPKDFPYLVRQMMAVIGKLRGMAREFQSGMDQLVRETELDDVRRQVQESLDSADFRQELVRDATPEERADEAEADAAQALPVAEGKDGTDDETGGE